MNGGTSVQAQAAQADGSGGGDGLEEGEEGDFSEVGSSSIRENEPKPGEAPEGSGGIADKATPHRPIGYNLHIYVDDEVRHSLDVIRAKLKLNSDSEAARVAIIRLSASLQAEDIQSH